MDFKLSPADGIDGFKQFLLGEDKPSPRDTYGIGKKLADLEKRSAEARHQGAIKQLFNTKKSKRVTHADYFKTRGLAKQANFLENPADIKMVEKPMAYGSAVATTT